MQVFTPYRPNSGQNSKKTCTFAGISSESAIWRAKPAYLQAFQVGMYGGTGDHESTSRFIQMGARGQHYSPFMRMDAQVSQLFSRLCTGDTGNHSSSHIYTHGCSDTRIYSPFIRTGTHECTRYAVLHQFHARSALVTQVTNFAQVSTTDMFKVCGFASISRTVRSSYSSYRFCTSFYDGYVQGMRDLYKLLHTNTLKVCGLAQAPTHDHAPGVWFYTELPWTNTHQIARDCMSSYGFTQIRGGI